MAPRNSDISTQALTSRSSEDDADDQLANDPTPPLSPNTSYIAWKRKVRYQIARARQSGSKHSTIWQCPDPYCDNVYSDGKTLSSVTPPRSTPSSTCHQALNLGYVVRFAKRGFLPGNNYKIMKGHYSRMHWQDEFHGRWQAGTGEEEKTSLLGQAGRSSGGGDAEGQGGGSEQRDHVEG